MKYRFHQWNHKFISASVKKAKVP